jgi:hypothetical protein
MSRPNSSVPNQCWRLGGWNWSGTDITSGSCGATSGAASAISTINPRIDAPAMAW